VNDKRPQCPTAQDALKQALVAVLSDQGSGVVTDVTFGRYADLEAGWYWSADITRKLVMPGSKLGQDPDDTIERKVHCVVEKWLLDTASKQDFTRERGQ
jgi:hypothetical protein